MKKKFLFLAVMALAVAALVSVFAFTASADTEGYYTYTVSNGEATITSVDNAISGDVVIPDTLGGVPVTSIGDGAFAGCTDLILIEIPASVTSIGDGAFADCTGLELIAIPSSVTSIGDWAFAGCTNLILIEIPASVTSIGDWAFAGCTHLILIEIPASVTSIGDGAFADCEGLELIAIPSSVTSIGDGAFADCEGLTSIAIPTSVTSIGEYAFGNCTGLTSIEIPSSVTSIASSAFENCTSLTLVDISDLAAWCGISFDGASANPLCYAGNLYLNGSLVTELVIPEGVTSIGDYAFGNCTGLTSIAIPASVTSIGDYAFDNCTSLTSIEIPASVTSIGDRAFYWCEGLTSIAIPASVTSIGNRAFEYCTSLTSVSFGENSQLTSIGEYAFADCEGLTSITIPDSVTSIGSSAFENCTNLTSIAISTSVTSIGNWAFYGCTGLTSIAIPASVTSIGWGAFSDCRGLTSITVDANNSVYHSAGNCLIETESKTLIAGCKNSVIPSDGSVTSIGNWAFYNCTGLTSIAIPASVTSIGDGAFYGCTGLTSIAIPASVTSIGNWAFEYCTGLTSVSFGENSQLTSIGDYAFADCEGLTTIAIPASVTSIGGYAFSGCTGLTSIAIPASVTSIGYRAFEYCTALETVYYEGTRSKWDAIGFASNIANPTYYGAELICLGKEDPCANGHTYGDWVETKAPTYTEDGIETRTCVNDASHTETRAKAHPDLVEEWFCGASVKARLFNDPDNTGKYFLYIFGTGAMTNDATVPGYYRTGITDIMVGSGVTSIGDDAFSWCTGLMSIAIPSSVTSIGDHAFWNCTGLTSIAIPSSVTSIGVGAFWNCTGLTSIAIPASVTSIGEDAFADCEGLTSITVETGNSVYHSAGNCLIETASKTLIAGCKNSVIPSDGSVTSIGSSAFYWCTGLTSIEIPASVTSIGIGAFYGCTGLKLVTIQSTAIAKAVTSSYACCGYLCGYAETVVLPTTITEIGSYITENFTYVDSLTVDGEAINVYSEHSHAVNATTWDGDTCTACGLVKQAALKISGAYLNLSENLNLFYTTTVPAGYENPYMVFEMNGESYTVTNYTVRPDGKLAFAFGAVRPQYFGDSIKATLYATCNGVTLEAVKESYSVREYCANQLSQCASNEDLVRVVSDILAYGDATQVYLGYKTDDLSSDSVSYTPGTFVALDSTANKKALTGEADARITWKSAGVRLENTLAIYVRFKTTVAAEDAAVHFEIAGKSVTAQLSRFTPDEEGYYTVYVRGIAATELDETFTATFLVDGEAVGQTLNYSVNSYIYSNQNSTDAALQGLVRALYNYGKSARIYAALEM